VNLVENTFAEMARKKGRGRQKKKFLGKMGKNLGVRMHPTGAGSSKIRSVRGKKGEVTRKASAPVEGEPR